MDILGIGPLELLFVLIIALIVFGPKDMAKAGRTIGRFLRMLVTSETWMVIQQTSKDIRNIPNRLIREAGIEDLQNELPTVQSVRKELDLDNIDKEIKESMNNDIADWTTPPPSIAPPITPVPKEQTEIQSTLTSPTEQSGGTTKASDDSRDSHTLELSASDLAEEPEKSTETVSSDNIISDQEESAHTVSSSDEPESAA